MPVGKVFNAAENQVLISPVTSYYQGKAIRAAEKEAEQISELRGLQIDEKRQEIADAPSKREAAKQKALLEAENIRSTIDERYAKGERESLVYADTVMKPLFAAYSGEEDEDKALEIFNTGMPEAISRLPKDQQEGFLKMAGEDRVFSHDEIMLAGLARRTVEDKENSYTVLSTEEKLAMNMPEDWARNTVVERDQEGNLTFNNRPTGTTPEDLERDPRTSSQAGKAFQDAKDSYDGSSAIQEQIGSFLPRAQSLPDSVGGVARMAQSVSAVVGLLGNDASAEAIANAMTSTDQETLASMRAQLQLIRGRIRPLVTGDYGKRQSDKELEISNKVLGLAETIETPLDLLKNYPQVMGGLKELYGATLIEQYQQAKKTEGIDYPYDLSTDAGIEDIATVMNAQGIDDDNIVRFIKRLQQIQEVTL